MTFVRLRFLLAIAMLLSSFLVASAQWRTTNSIRSYPDRYEVMSLLPGDINVYSPDQTTIFVTGFLGLNHNTNMGKFRTDCDCEFTGEFSLKNIGAVIGAFIMGVMNNGMSIMGIGIDYQFVIKGAVLMLAVFLDVYYKNKAA